MKCQLLLLSTLAISACSQTPPIEANYFGSKTGMAVKLVQTIACDKENRPIVAFTASANVTQTADYANPMKATISGLDGDFGNSDIKFEMTPDGRLKSFNAVNEGNGENIVKSAVSLVGTLAAATSVQPMAEQCKALKKLNDKDPITINYERLVENFSESEAETISPTTLSKSYYEKFHEIAGKSCITIGSPYTNTPVNLIQTGNANRFVNLPAKQPAFVPVSVTTGRGGSCTQDVLWSGLVPVGQLGRAYTLPIPKAAIFGKQTFAVAFDDSGALISLQYAKDSGIVQSLNATQHLAEMAKSSTAAERAAKLGAEADLIVAQQRLVKCQASPETCE